MWGIIIIFRLHNPKKTTVPYRDYFRKIQTFFIALGSTGGIIRRCDIIVNATACQKLYC